MKNKSSEKKGVIRTHIKFRKDYRDYLKKLAVDKGSNIAGLVETAVNQVYKIEK
jgi:hypothetical protein